MAFRSISNVLFIECYKISRTGFQPVLEYTTLVPLFKFYVYIIRYTYRMISQSLEKVNVFPEKYFNFVSKH